MTGTADTEAAEFKKIYDLEVLVIPTNMPMIRIDFPDVIYQDPQGKVRSRYRMRLKRFTRKANRCWWVRVNIDVSEQLSKKLKKQGIPHDVLNAKNHEKRSGDHRQWPARKGR